jgi:hypothetical protein
MCIVISYVLVSTGMKKIKGQGLANGITQAQPNDRHIYDAVSMPRFYYSFFTACYVIFLVFVLR